MLGGNPVWTGPALDIHMNGNSLARAKSRLTMPGIYWARCPQECSDMQRLISPILTRRPALLAGPLSGRRYDAVYSVKAHREARMLNESAQRILAVSARYMLAAA